MAASGKVSEGRPKVGGKDGREKNRGRVGEML